MLYELTSGEYSRVRALVAGLAYHLSIQAVIDGTVVGRIWVDSVLAPQAAFILTPEGQYLAGQPANPAFQQALADLLLTIPGVHLTYRLGANLCWPPSVQIRAPISSPLLYLSTISVA